MSSPKGELSASEASPHAGDTQMEGVFFQESKWSRGPPPKWLTTKNIQKTLAIQVASIFGGGDGENYMILPKDCLVVFCCFNGGLHPP